MYMDVNHFLHISLNFIEIGSADLVKLRLSHWDLKTDNISEKMDGDI